MEKTFFSKNRVAIFIQVQNRCLPHMLQVVEDERRTRIALFVFFLFVGTFHPLSVYEFAFLKTNKQGFYEFTVESVKGRVNKGCF